MLRCVDVTLLVLAWIWCDVAVVCGACDLLCFELLDLRVGVMCITLLRDVVCVCVLYCVLLWCVGVFVFVVLV